MPDAQYAPSFWTGVANAFKGNNAVMFDLFNEPYPERATGDATSGWKCWRDGGTCAGIPYQVAGFQGLINTVRENDCAHGFADGLMDWADAYSVGYLGWTWNNWDCSTGPALITDWNGTATPYGQGAGRERPARPVSM
jgi:hypothetical protein